MQGEEIKGEIWACRAKIRRNTYYGQAFRAINGGGTKAFSLGRHFIR